MNKLVIVGNGFDLAPRSPTSYKHFIDDFWSNFQNNCGLKEISEPVVVDKSNFRFFEFSLISKFDDMKSILIKYAKIYECRKFDEAPLKCTTITSGKPPSLGLGEVEELLKPKY